MSTKEKRKLIEGSITKVKLFHEDPRNNQPVKLCQLNEAASKVAAEIADFETPWFQSLKLMVDAAGVTFEDEFVPVEGTQMNQEISDRVIKRIPRKLKAITPNKTNIEFGHSGLECFKLFSRTRFYEHVGFAFLVRRIPKSDWKTDPYDLISVEDVGNEEEFWLFSSHGVLYTNGTYSEFYSLMEWARCYEFFYKCRQLRFFQQFKLKKYFHHWLARKKWRKFKKMREQFRLSFLQSEIELSQPIFAVSALIFELNNMELLPNISANHWSFSDFKNGSSDAHLSLAVMIENLFKFASTISFGTLKRLEEKLEEATKNVAELDRAPRSKKESWHVLRTELKQAQAFLKRFETARSNIPKLISHSYYRISSVLLNVYRNQLRFIWNRINSKPVITVTLRVDDQISLLPSVDDWMAAVRLHIFDLAPSIGLALQRAQHAHPNSLILNMVESKLFLTLQNDPESKALIKKILSKTETDLKETESFARSEQSALLELFQFIETYDSKKVQDQIFCQNGNLFIQQMFENFNRWKKQLTGKIYRIGCCTLSTKALCEEKLTSLESNIQSLENVTQLRIRAEIMELETLTEQLTKDLQFDSTEEIGEFADRVSQINQKILDSTEAGLRFVKVIKFLPETSKRYLLQINELNEKFKKINKRLEESKNFINEPSKLILQELSSKIEHQKEQSETVLGKLIELTNRTGSLDEAKILSESTSIYEQASRDHEKTQKLIHTITTLNNECQIDMKESDLSFYFAKHTFKVWSLINCIANKIEKIKLIEIGSAQLADNLNDLNRISDELSDSLGWIEAELPGRTAINKQTNSFNQKLNYWMRIMNEFKLLRSAKIRQKEIKKIKILLGFAYDDSTAFENIKLGQCEKIDLAYPESNVIRCHVTNMESFFQKSREIEKFFKNELIPISLSMEGTFYFGPEGNQILNDLIKIQETIDSAKIELRDYIDLGDDDEDRIIVFHYFTLGTTVTQLIAHLHHLLTMGQKCQFLKHFKGETEAEENKRVNFIGQTEMLFEQFENRTMIELIEMKSEINEIEVPNITKYLFIQRQKWPILQNITNENIIKLYSDRKFNINSISSLLPKLNLHGVKSITTRPMAIESSGEICSISMLDGSRITIGGLFYKDDTDPGFFLTKINKRVYECSKQAVYSTIQQILTVEQGTINTREFWFQLALPSGLACVVLDICSQLIDDEKQLDLDELRKSCLAEKNLDSSPNPRYIINLVNYFHFLKSNSKNYKNLYCSKLLLNREVATQLLVDNMEHVLTNDEIYLQEFQFDFWSGYQMSDSCSFVTGLFRVPLMDALSRKDKVAISLEKNYAKCLATLVGKKYLEIDESEIKQNISSSNIVYITSKFDDDDVTGYNSSLTKLALKLFNNKKRYNDHNEAVDQSASAFQLENPKSPENPEIPENQKNQDSNELFVSKSDHHGLSDCQILEDNSIVLFLPEVTSGSIRNEILEALTFDFHVENELSQSHIRYQLESYGMVGTRLIEQRLKTVISVLEPNMTWFDFDLYLTKSMDIYCLMEYGFRPEETPTRSVSVTSGQSKDASSLTSSKSATSMTSTKSERSEALSVDYSHKLNRAKNKDCSLALALYVTANRNASFLREKLVSNLIATMFTSVRKILFERLWERVINHVIYNLNKSFYFQYEKWSMVETKQFWSFMNLILLRLINNSNVKLLNTPVTEQIVLILFRSINELQRTDSSLLKLVMDSSSGSGSNNGSATLAEKIVKIGIELLPQKMTILSTENLFRGDQTWLFSGEGHVKGQNTINIYNDWSDGVISPPEFLWKMLAQNDLFNLDSCFDIPKPIADACRRQVIKWFEMANSRISEVLLNSINPQVQASSPYFAAGLSHWNISNSIRRCSKILKHFFEWARSHGYLPPTYEQNENCGYMNLILLSVYWGFALGLAPHARTAFSIELTSNILQLKTNKEDLSRVYLGTKLNFEKFIDLPEFDQQTMATKDFIKTNQFLLTKWLQSVFVPTDQSRFKSNFQLIGQSCSGKSTILYYFDKDHPKMPHQNVPAGDKSFHDQYDLNMSHGYATYNIIPDNLSNENVTKFTYSLTRPQISTASTESETNSYSYPFLQMNVNFQSDWQLILSGLIKAYVAHVNVKLVDKMQVEDFMFKVLSSILQKSAHKCSNLTAAKAMMRFLNSTRSEAREAFRSSEELHHGNLEDSFRILLDLFVRPGVDQSDIKKIIGSEVCESKNCVATDPKTKAPTKSLDLNTKKYYPISILKRTVGQLLLLLEFEDAVCLNSNKAHVGRRCAAYEAAHATGRQYFEITEDDFDLQMENAVRLNSELLFFCRQGSVSTPVWNKMVNFGHTHDIFTLISTEKVLTLLDPKGYLSDKMKIKATALAQIQKRWKRAKLVLAPTSTPTHNFTELNVLPWSQTDWFQYSQFHLKKVSKLTDSEIEKISKILSVFLTKNKLFYSPTLVSNMLELFSKNVAIRKAEAQSQYAKYEINSNILVDLSNKLENLRKELAQGETALNILNEQLKEANANVDSAESSYEEKYLEAQRTEQNVKSMEAKVKELIKLTDISSQLHPIFSRAQAILSRLNERDFEEIRTYRAPPVSVILVVEAICILFDVPPNWESGQALLHRENFFQDLEFYDKENLSQIAFRKMKQRLDRIDEQEVRKASQAALSLYFWLQAIAAFYLSYSRLKPLLKQRALSEKELARLEKKLGVERLELDQLKQRFEILDEISVKLSKDAVDLKCKNRRLQQSVEDAEVFLGDLDYCSSDWKEAQAKLKESLDNFNIEIISAFIYVFLLARFDSKKSKRFISSLIEIDKSSADHMTSFSDRKSLLGKFNGEACLTHHIGIQKAIKILESEKIGSEILQWDNHHENHKYEKVVFCDLEDYSDLRVDFIERFSKTNKLAKNDKILIRDKAIIEQEIQNFDKRLYDDLTCGKYDYGYLRRLVAGRKKAKADWHHTLTSTKSMITNYSSYDLVDFAIKAVEIFEEIDSKIYPSRLKMVQMAIDHMHSAQIYQSRDQLVSIFISYLYCLIDFFCFPDHTTLFKQFYSLFILEKRFENFDSDRLKNILILDQNFDKSKYEKYLTDEIMKEHMADELFSPFVEFWHFPELEPEDLIILHWMAGYDTWPVIFDICVGGYQVQSMIVEPDQTIISINHAGIDFDMIETMNLFSKAEFIIGGQQTKKYDSQCAIQLDSSALSTLELSIIKREEALPYTTYSEGVPIFHRNSTLKKSTTYQSSSKSKISTESKIEKNSIFHWIDHNNSFSSIIDIGCLYFILTNQNAKCDDLTASQIADFISNPKRVPTSSLSSPLASFLNIIGARKLNGDCVFKLASEDSSTSSDPKTSSSEINLLPVLVIDNLIYKLQLT